MPTPNICNYICTNILPNALWLMALSFSMGTHAKNLELVKDIKSDLLVYEPTLKALVPNIDNLVKTNNVYFFVRKSEGVNHYLKIRSFSDFSLFVQGKLFKSYPEGTHIINMQDFFISIPFYQEAAISIYTKNGINSIYSAEIYKYVHQSLPLITEYHPRSSGIRSTNSAYKNKYITGVIFFLIVFLLIKSLLPDFLTRVFSAMPQVEALFERTSSKLRYYNNESIFYAFIVSFIIGIYCYMFSDKFYILSKLGSTDSTSSFYSFVVGFIVSITSFAAKFIVNKLVSLVFSLSNFANIISYEFSKTVFQLLILLGPVYLYVLSPYQYTEPDFTKQILYPFVVLVVVFMLKELYYFFKIFHFNKFYLFAYICICDLFPTCILLKTLTQIEVI